jgi:tetratricopeptide (TPR) repeat protein
MKPGTVVRGRFAIERHAGSGAMGAVYRAIDRLTGEPVALKVLLDASSDARADRLAREAEALAELSHPHIVRYVDHGVLEGGRAYLAMEWLEGETLSARLAAKGLTIAETVALGSGVAAALAAAHARGIVHRDVKPSNLLLVGGDPARVKVLDFGIAHLRAGARRLTATGEMLGTPGYMAPEQARGESTLDARSDVFALGAVLFECLTGRPAFEGDGAMMVLLKVVLEEPPRVGSLRPEVSRALDELVMRMLDKSPAARPANGDAVLAELCAITPSDDLAPPSLRDAPTITAFERRVLCLALARPLPGGGLPARAGALREAAARWGGELDLLADGSLIAAFSSAGAATDQAARAARAALEISRALPGVPIALVTGHGEAHARWAMGELIDRGVRMIARAAMGGVRIDEVTLGLLGAAFDVRGDAGDPGGLSLAGERADPGTGRTLLGKVTPFVGRDREIGMLAGLIQECAAEPVAQAAIVLGAAGLGKSRLRHELGRRARDVLPGLEVWIGRGDPMSAGSPFGMLGQAVRRAAGVIDGEPLEVRRTKLRARVGRHVAAREVPRVAEFIAELAGLPCPDEPGPELYAARQSPILMGDQIRRALVDLLEAELAQHPVLLVLEDLHWGDRPSVDLVDFALRNLADRPLFVLALGRPEVTSLFPRLWEERRAHVIRLGELSKKASLELVRVALGDRVSDEAAASIVDRAAGNAFYLEELIRAAEGGAQAGEFPATVLAMVEARLEALDPEDRRVLRAASVFGTTFSRGGVAALLGHLATKIALAERLESLVRRELLVASRRPRFPGEDDFVFRHALVREAAYGMLTDRDRVAGHRAAGEWLERAGETDAIVLAEHFDRGGRPDLSIGWYRRAAAQALEGNDFAAAIARAERAIAAGAAGEVKGELLGILAEVRIWSGEYAVAAALAKEALALLPRGGKPWCTVASELVMASLRGDDPSGVAALAREIAALDAEVLEDHHVLLLARLAGYLFVLGQVRPGSAILAATERALARPRLSDGVLAWVNHARSWERHYLDDAAGALRFEELAVACFDAAGDRRNGSTMRANLGVAYRDLGALAPAEVVLREALRTAERMNLPGAALAVKQNLAMVLAQQGALAEAEALERAAADGFARESNRRMEGGSRAYLALILAQRGDLDTAEREARLAVAILGDHAPSLPYALAALARVLLDAARPVEARAAAREAMERLGDVEGIHEGEALIRLVHAEALLALGDAGAGEALAAARDRLLDRAARIGEPALRESFLAVVPEHARTLALAGDYLAAPIPANR